LGHPQQTHPKQLALNLSPSALPVILESIRPQLRDLLATLIRQAADVEPDGTERRPGGDDAR